MQTGAQVILDRIEVPVELSDRLRLLTLEERPDERVVLAPGLERRVLDHAAKVLDPDQLPGVDEVRVDQSGIAARADNRPMDLVVTVDDRGLVLAARQLAVLLMQCLDVRQFCSARVFARKPDRECLERSLEHKVVKRSLEALAIGLACEHASAAELSHVEALHKKHRKLASGKDKSAVIHCNNEVHRAIVCASGNSALIDAHLINSRQLIRIQNLRGMVEHSALESWREHDAFVGPLLERQKTKAVAQLNRHFDTIEDHLRARLHSGDSRAARASA